MNYQNIKKKTEGFTIIEVLIVLAIAGLIMLIVFLAVPALQRNSRNNSRNSEASRISSAITDCLANRNGVIDSCNEDSEIQVGTLNQLSLPSGSFPVATDLGSGTTDTVEIGFERICNEAGSEDADGGPRDFAVTWVNENNVTRCLGSQ